MKRMHIDNTELLKKVLEEHNDETIEICLENKTYELNETITVKRSNFRLDGNGSTIKGSKKIDISLLEKKDGIVVIDLEKHGIETRNYHGIRFPWCHNKSTANDVTNRPEQKDAFGTTFITAPRCGGVYGIDNAGPDIEVYFEGKKMSVTRYPKSGYMKIEKTHSDKESGEGASEGIFSPDDKKFTKMNKAEEALLFGYWAWDWSPHFHSIKSVDSDNNIITVDEPYDIWGYNDARGEEKIRAKFFAINVYDALDEPGTWFVDRKNKLLYVYPYPGQDYIEVSACKTFFKGENITGALFENLSVCQGQSCGFHFENSKNISISNVSVTNICEWAIVVQDCTSVTVSDTKVLHTGGGGIYLCGGERLNLISSENKILNCEVSDIAQWYRTYTSAIEIRGVGTVVSGCKLYNLPHFAILFSGNNHIMENNEFFDVCRFSNDAGAIYSGRDFTFYGNIIRNNYLHDIYGMDGGGCTGIYFDDCMSSAEVYGNIFANVAYPIQLGGGHDFKIHHNTFFNCDLFFFDNRGRNGFWAHEGAVAMRNQLKNSPYKNEVWKNAYPELYNADIDSDDFFLPYNNSLTDNVFIKCGDFYVEDPDVGKMLKMENNTFIKRDKPKIYDRSNACDHLLHLFKIYNVFNTD